MLVFLLEEERGFGGFQAVGVAAGIWEPCRGTVPQGCVPVPRHDLVFLPPFEAAAVWAEEAEPAASCRFGWNRRIVWDFCLFLGFGT